MAFYEFVVRDGVVWGTGGVSRGKMTLLDMDMDMDKISKIICCSNNKRALAPLSMVWEGRGIGRRVCGELGRVLVRAEEGHMGTHL